MIIKNLIRTTLRQIPTPTINAIATLGPIGYLPKAPGTYGSIAGLLFFSAFLQPLSSVPHFIIVGLLIYLSVHLCGEAEARMHKKDPPEIILDEFVAIPLAFIGTDWISFKFPTWILMLSGFLLFRFFDIVKPFGIKSLQDYPNGVGVVADDLAAALYACVSLHLIFYLLL